MNKFFASVVLLLLNTVNANAQKSYPFPRIHQAILSLVDARSVDQSAVIEETNDGIYSPLINVSNVPQFIFISEAKDARISLFRAFATGFSTGLCKERVSLIKLTDEHLKCGERSLLRNKYAVISLIVKL